MKLICPRQKPEVKVVEKLIRAVVKTRFYYLRQRFNLLYPENCLKQKLMLLFPPSWTTVTPFIQPSPDLTPGLFSLHLLPVYFRICFKIVLHMFSPPRSAVQTFAAAAPSLSASTFSLILFTFISLVFYVISLILFIYYVQH